MSPWFWVFLGAVGGVAAATQSPLVSMVSQRLGVMEGIFIIHLGGALASLLPLLVKGGGGLSQWRTLPWYALAGGALGLVILSTISYCIPQLGVAATISAFVAGQLMFGLVLDQMGWLGTPLKPLEWQRLFGLFLVLSGTWLMLSK